VDCVRGPAGVPTLFSCGNADRGLVDIGKQGVSGDKLQVWADKYFEWVDKFQIWVDKYFEWADMLQIWVDKSVEWVDNF
jgi:hypothetical protein